MKTCNCGGNNSLRSAIGAVRCECGGALNDAQIRHRIISRIEEIEEDQFKMIGALQRLGADKCDQCGDWDVDTWCECDHCMCKHCLEGNPEGPLCDEDLNEEECERVERSIIRYLTGRGITIRSKRLNQIRAALPEIR